MYKSLRHALLLALLCSPVLAVAVENSIRHPFLAAQPKKAPEEVLLAMEIPAGSFTKYEINEEGLVYVDRFQSVSYTHLDVYKRQV